MACLLQCLGQAEHLLNTNHHPHSHGMDTRCQGYVGREKADGCVVGCKMRMQEHYR